MNSVMTLTTTLEGYLDNRIQEIAPEIRQAMLQHIGNPDSYLRDKLIYESFVKLIYSNQLNQIEIQALLDEIVQENFLFYRIGESKTDSVFTRSFSVLAIAAVIEFDLKNQLLDLNSIRFTINRVIQYMLEERDTRGFIHEKGWAHAIAHGADTLDALSKHPQINIEDITQILHAVKHSLFRQVDYLAEEEERLASVIASLIKHQDVELEIQSWLTELTGIVETLLDENTGSIESYQIQRNVKNFLKSVYIILKSKNIGDKLNAQIIGTLEKWMYIQ